jgi:hypothetical protein
MLLRKGANQVISRDHADHISDTEFLRNGIVVTRAGRGVHVLDEISKGGGKYYQLFKVLLELSEHNPEERQQLNIDMYEPNTGTPLHRVAAITDSKPDLEFMGMLLSNGARLYPSHEGRGNLTEQLPFDRAMIDWVEEVKSAGFLPSSKGSKSGDAYIKLLAFLDYFQRHHREHLPILMARVLELWLYRGEPSLDSTWSLLYHTFKLHGVSIQSTSLIRAWVLQSLRQPRLEQTGEMSVAEAMDFLPKLGFPTTLLHPLDELLLEAVRNGLAAETSWLIENGADVNAVCPTQGSGPLHMAAVSGDESLLKLLLAQGADIQLPNRRGDTAVQLAVRFRRDQIVECLKPRGADVDACLAPAAARTGSRQGLGRAKVSQRVF